MRQTFDDETIQVTRETTAHDVAEWDSLTNVELIVALEMAFGVKFYTGELAGFRNVGELADTITARLRDPRP
jgi:acyl carrier protein